MPKKNADATAPEAPIIAKEVENAPVYIAPKHAQTEITKSTSPAAKAQYLDLFSRSIDAILLVDINSAEIIEANDAAAKMFRLPLEQLQRTTVYEHCRQDFLENFKKFIRIASRRYHPKTFEIPLEVGESKKAKLTTEMAASPLKLRDETEVLQLIFRDVTEKKDFEKKLAEYIITINDANKKLEELATTDGMTGLANFRQFTKLLDAEHTRSARYASKYSIIFCDVDHFKKYNDQNGHPAGDALLRRFAEILKSSIRNTDIAARYGGEEFVVLCPETDVGQAVKVAERVLNAVAKTRFDHGEKQPMGFVSVSIGVSGYPQSGADYKAVLKAADEMLYRSKENGRNRVTVVPGA